MGREEEKWDWEMSGPPPGPPPAATEGLSDTDERWVINEENEKKGEKKHKRKRMETRKMKRK